MEPRKIGTWKLCSFNPSQVYTGEVARLRSYVTQRPPFDVKNPFMGGITVNKNLHKVTRTSHLTPPT